MSDLNYIHIMAYKTEEDDEVNLYDKEPIHIDSIAQQGQWKATVQQIIDENKEKYHRIFLEDNHGVDLTAFSL